MMIWSYSYIFKRPATPKTVCWTKHVKHNTTQLTAAGPPGHFSMESTNGSHILKIAQVITIQIKSHSLWKACLQPTTNTQNSKPRPPTENLKLKYVCTRVCASVAQCGLLCGLLFVRPTRHASEGKNTENNGCTLVHNTEELLYTCYLYRIRQFTVV